MFTFAGDDAKNSNDDTNKILKEVHNMLYHLIKRVEGTEKELKSMKVRLSTPSSDSSSASKRTVPLVVKVSSKSTCASKVLIVIACTEKFSIKHYLVSLSNPWPCIK